MPTILVVNDDGIQSVGITTLAEKLEKLGEVIVVTPDGERSGIGKSLSIGQVNVKKTRVNNKITAYAISGTPADSFLIASNKILKRMPDLVVSGINLGPNLGIDDVLTSGTLGATMEAAIHNVPAIALSYCIQKITDKTEKEGITNKDLELAATLAYKTAKHVLENGMPDETDIISINVPENADCNRVRTTHLCYEGYGDIHTENEDGYRILSWALTHYPDGEHGTDLHAIREGYISVTPIKLKLTHNTKAIKDLLDSFSEETK